MSGNETIRFSTDAMEEIVAQLKRVQSEILSQKSQMSAICSSIEKQSGAELELTGGNASLHCGAKINAGQLKSMLGDYEKAFSACANGAKSLSGAVMRASGLFEEKENELLKRFEGIGVSSGSSFNVGNAAQGSAGTDNLGLGNIVSGLSKMIPQVLKLVMPKGSISGDWLGYEFSEDSSQVTAWLGKVSGNAKILWTEMNVNAYVGKAEGHKKLEFNFMDTQKKKEYVDGKWVEKEEFKVIEAVGEIGGSASVFSIDGSSETGNDMLGSKTEVEGSLLTGKAGAKGEFSIGDDGINLNVQGEAIVAAAEGKVSKTISILGIDITVDATGYAGAAGVEGKVGIEDNKFVLKGGAAAGYGGAIGLQVGFNDEGWDNFVDFVTFWD